MRELNQLFFPRLMIGEGAEEGPDMFGGFLGRVRHGGAVADELPPCLEGLVVDAQPADVSCELRLRGEPVVDPAGGFLGGEVVCEVGEEFVQLVKRDGARAGHRTPCLALEAHDGPQELPMFGPGVGYHPRLARPGITSSLFMLQVVASVMPTVAG